MAAEHRRDDGEARLSFGMQPVPALDGEGLVAQLLVARDAVHVRAHLVLLLQHLLRAQDLAHDRARSKERHAPTPAFLARDRKSTRLNSSHTVISYAVFCLKKKT